MSIPPARLLPHQDPAEAVELDPERPFTIGRDPANALALPQEPSLSRRHAVIRVSRRQGRWILCDLGSANGTYLGGEKVERCRPLSDGDEIRLGRRGPAFLFRCEEPGGGHDAAARSFSAAAVRTSRSGGGSTGSAGAPIGAVSSGGAGRRSAPPAAGAAAPAAGRSGRIEVQGRRLALDQLLSASVRSERRFPHIFSWWLLLSLGGLMVLPFPWLFWPLQVGLLGGWIVLGSLREHILVITLRDGMAFRHVFASRATALSHCNGIRRALGQSPDDDGDAAGGRG